MQITFETLPKAVTTLQESVNEIKRLLLERSNEPQPEAEELLTVQDTAKFLSLSVPTVTSSSLEMWKQHILKLAVDFILHLLVALMIHYLF